MFLQKIVLLPGPLLYFIMLTLFYYRGFFCYLYHSCFIKFLLVCFALFHIKCFLQGQDPGLANLPREESSNPCLGATSPLPVISELNGGKEAEEWAQLIPYFITVLYLPPTLSLGLRLEVLRENVSAFSLDCGEDRA